MDNIANLIERVESGEMSRSLAHELSEVLGTEVQFVSVGPRYDRTVWAKIDRSGVAPVSRHFQPAACLREMQGARP